MAMAKRDVGKEFARRAKMLHFEGRANHFDKEKIPKIRLWGLFQWGAISPYIKTGEIIPDAGFAKVNRIIWCQPSAAFYHKWIKPHM